MSGRIALPVALWVLPLGCSLLVGSEPTPLLCSEEGRLGPPACDVGQVCRSGECRAASPSAPPAEPPTAAGNAGVGGDSGLDAAGGEAGGRWRPP